MRGDDWEWMRSFQIDLKMPHDFIQTSFFSPFTRKVSSELFVFNSLKVTTTLTSPSNTYPQTNNSHFCVNIYSISHCNASRFQPH